MYVVYLPARTYGTICRTYTFVYLPARTYDTIQNGKIKKNDSNSQQQQYRTHTRHITLHHVEQLVAVLQQCIIHTCSRQSSVAPPASTLIGATASSKKSRWYSSSMYVLAVLYEKNMLPNMMSLQIAEISDGTPVAGQHMDTAVIA